ncbi:CoB--CoM heterodisulfide reductase subunit B [invertebrate metagenome]|uniref:CoB--CoM heterodisulfide reductase subunit B n=1 Tax=invertebrate metagenome TaxID=1711999 RepID=A0A484H733_9ZZZZ
MSKKYTFYPGCASQGTGKHLDTSLRAVLPKLGVELQDIDDWNCCGASIGHVQQGHLATAALTARNLSRARANGTNDFVTACPACYLNSHYFNEQVRNHDAFRSEINAILGAASRSYDGDLHVRHICEVLVNDVGLDRVRENVVKPLKGLKVAGYIGCQTLRPFAGTERGGRYDTYEEPKFLDNFIEVSGATPIRDFKYKTSCCGGAVSAVSPDKTLHLMEGILKDATDKGADCICTPCALCQTNVEIYQDMVNKQFETSYAMPVVFYSQLWALSFGMDPKKDAAMHQSLLPVHKILSAAK